MSSYPHQPPLPNFSNGLPQQPQQQQQQSLPPQQNMMSQSSVPQSMGINKFLPPPSQHMQQTTGSGNLGIPPSNIGLQQNQQLHQQQPLSPEQQQQNHLRFMRQNQPLTNGGSAHSSRTASPAMNASFNLSINKSHLPPSSLSQGIPQNQVQPNITATSTNTLLNQNVQQSTNSSTSSLSGSMQNLSLGSPYSNGSLSSHAGNANINQRPPNSNMQTNIAQNFKPQPITAPYPNTQAAAVSQSSLQTNPSAPFVPGRIQSPNIQKVSNANSFTSSNFYGPPANATLEKPITSNSMANLNPPIPPVNLPQHNSTPLLPGQLTNQQMSVNNNPQYPQTFVSPQQIPANQPVKKQMYPNPRPQAQTQPYSQAYQPQSQQQQQQRHQPQQQPQPQTQQQQYQPTFNGQQNAAKLQYQQTPPMGYNQPSIVQQGFSRLWGQDTIDLMQHRHILPHEKIQPPKITLNNQFHESVNCNSDIMRCTLTKIPESNNLLQKSRLPLGILVHPFRDINGLPVIQCPNIVRCRLCRTYINPFVYFVDSKMWKCNLCYRVNELPEDFQYDPATKTYGDVTRRPEVRSSTIEFIAPAEYMLRPPQPAIYLFLFDVSILAQQSGYLETVCSVLSKHLEDMPGDARTQVGFIAYNSEIHFYNIAEGYNQPHEMTLVDIDDAFLPCPDNLLINLNECKELIKDLLTQLPTRFANSHDPGSALGAALQVAYKLMCGSGGRVTVFQTCLPNKGPGTLQPREDPNNRSSKEILHLNPATDFYKRHALECSGYQIAVDLFLLNQQYSDLATISGVSKYSGGGIYHFPLFQKTKPQHVDALKQCFKRYLTRKIGFEAVMRIRCTRGLQVHTFHGNFFVRSTDLLSLPNVNPDAAYGMQISYEESLTDVKTICFQAALLYTNSEGERRIRVHTLCLPVSSSLGEIMHSADSQSIVALLSKMAVDRSLSTSISDAREAFINATVDVMSAFKLAQNLPAGQSGQLIVPKNLALLPLYISALLKHVAFRIGTSTRLDDRVAAMDAMKTLPLDQLMKNIYPELYSIDCLFYNVQNSNKREDDDQYQDPPILQLTAEYLDSRSMFLLDSGSLIIIYVGINVPTNILESVLGISSSGDIPDYCFGLPSLNTPENEALKNFINNLNEDKPYLPTIQIIRDTSTCRTTFTESLIDDRGESSLSYYEFLQHLQTQVK